MGPTITEKFRQKKITTHFNKGRIGQIYTTAKNVHVIDSGHARHENRKTYKYCFLDSDPCRADWYEDSKLKVLKVKNNGRRATHLQAA